MDIAAIGLAHFADALTGKMSQCTVSEWLADDGKPVVIYWKPLTGEIQKIIDGAGDYVSRTCLTVKSRALDADGKLIFKKTPIESLAADYDYSVLRAIAYLMATDISGDIDEQIEATEKE